ncbi:hypothetical protein F3Y22_tig00110258pilonHSYRG00155 [Hibiscus syriacus]|uniref:DC1 domain-containing protein n=1 Tax=Hibiscus syriacus TaxID=106335 RepID=A0A6A3B9F5_HIBSY|nr:uncharacterized protein LOC120115189 [Hibiscus syriacus]KAE8712318.1 hypothetical protein F3Y22_tig00110258pilonHSYRG00155 [Hibiscus syriacus]
MEDSNNYGHHHPLVRLNEEQLMSYPSGVAADCSRCGEKVSAPCFRCAEDCGFYVHKICAQAPAELNHPFHQQQPLVLLQNPPSIYTRFACNFCGETCEKFVYHCSSCHLGFHIKCALFTFNIAKSNLKELKNVPFEPPMTSTNKDDEQLEDVPKCFACWEPLANYTYFSTHCGLLIVDLIYIRNVLSFHSN